MGGNAAGSAPAGARPEDWSLLAGLGLTEDLLPVVSAPEVRIHPQSKMKDLGKTPSRISADGHAVGIPGWTQHRSTDRQVAGWSKDGRLGICLQTRRVRALDIDIADPVRATAVREFVELVQGVLPVRWREGSGKCLLAFTMEGDFSKRVLRTEHGPVEFLATGQQFVAFGRHTSGERYQWSGLEMVEVLGEFPQVTPAEFEVLWAGLTRAFPGLVDNTRRGVAPSVARSKTDMHGDPMVGFLHENGWVREFDRDGRVHVRCPWEHEHTTDSGPTATTYFPAGVGGFAQGHWRCLHAHCAGRGDAEFQEAIGYEVSLFEDLVAQRAQGAVVGTPDGGAGSDAGTGADGGGPGGGALVELAAPSAVVPGDVGDLGPWPVLTRDKSGRIEATMRNTVACIERPDIVGCSVAFDDFRGQVLVAWDGVAEWRPLRDGDYVDVRSALEARGFRGVGKEMVRDAIGRVAEKNRMDSAITWARSLRWDGVERIDSFLPQWFGVVDTPYTRAVGAYMWTALAGRAVAPGVKADMVPVFIGGQGAGKTRLVECLAPEESTFVEIDLTNRDDNLARMLRGKLVGELAELRGLASREAESIKAWISRRVEEWTPKWVEHTAQYPRRLLMIGTGNNPEFLDDDTGERRWLPVEVGKVDVEAVREVRTQLWAEAVARFNANGVEWQRAEALARDQHRVFKVEDPWREAIARWLALDDMDSTVGELRGDRPLAVVDVLVGALRLELRNITRREELRAGKVLRGLGYAKKDMRFGGGVVKRWCKE